MNSFRRNLSFENPQMNYADHTSPDNWALGELGLHGKEKIKQAAMEYGNARNNYIKNSTPENARLLTEKTAVFTQVYTALKEHDLDRYVFAMRGLEVDKKILDAIVQTQEEISPLQFLSRLISTTAEKIKSMNISY